MSRSLNGSLNTFTSRLQYECTYDVPCSAIRLLSVVQVDGRLLRDSAACPQTSVGSNSWLCYVESCFCCLSPDECWLCYVESCFCCLSPDECWLCYVESCFCCLSPDECWLCYGESCFCCLSPNECWLCYVESCFCCLSQDESGCVMLSRVSAACPQTNVGSNGWLQRQFVEMLLSYQDVEAAARWAHHFHLPHSDLPHQVAELLQQTHRSVYVVACRARVITIL